MSRVVANRHPAIAQTVSKMRFELLRRCATHIAGSVRREEALSGHVLYTRFWCWIGLARRDASRASELRNGGVREFEWLEDAVGTE